MKTYISSHVCDGPIRAYAVITDGTVVLRIGEAGLPEYLAPITVFMPLGYANLLKRAVEAFNAVMAEPERGEMREHAHVG